MKEKIKIATYGGGVNSTAMILLLMEQEIKLDYIVFADTGGEKPNTYEYIKYFNSYLVDKLYTPIKIIKRSDKTKSIDDTLRDEIIRRETLPAIAFGFKTCSLKWKVEPSDRYIKSILKKEQYPYIKYVGYDTDEEHRIKKTIYPKYELRYPLIDAEFDRADCKKYIEKCGLKVPPKSSCYFCPSMKGYEIIELQKQYPELLTDALAIEKNAMPNLDTVKGLGRTKSWDSIIQQQVINFEPIQKNCGCKD